MTITYDYILHKVSDPAGGVLSTSGKSVLAVGLDPGEQYNIKVRERNTDQVGTGVIYLSPWTSFVNFSTLAVPTTVVVNLLSISNHSVLLNNLTAFVEQPAPVTVMTYSLRVERVGTGVTQINNINDLNYSLTGLVTGDSYIVSVRQESTLEGVIYYSPWVVASSFIAGGVVIPPVVVDMGNIAHSVLLNNLTAFVEQPAPAIVLTYSLRVEEVGVGTTYINSISPTEYLLTNLTIDATYIVSVRLVKQSGGIIYLSPWSVTESFVAESQFKVLIDLGTINHSVTLNNITPVVDPFELESFNYENTQGQPFKVFGTTTKALQSITVSINGSPMMVSHSSKNWEAVVFQGALELSQMEELDGPQTLVINNITLEIA